MPTELMVTELWFSAAGATHVWHHYYYRDIRINSAYIFALADIVSATYPTAADFRRGDTYTAAEFHSTLK